MNRHLSAHEHYPKKRYFCVLCDSGFTRKHDLKRHMGRKHNVNEEIQVELENEQMSAEEYQSEEESVAPTPRHYQGYCQSMQAWLPLTECKNCFALIQYQDQPHRCPSVDCKEWKDATFIKALLRDMTLIVKDNE